MTIENLQLTIFRIASAFRGKMYRQHNDKLVFIAHALPGAVMTAPPT